MSYEENMEQGYGGSALIAAVYFLVGFLGVLVLARSLTAGALGGPLPPSVAPLSG